MRAQRPRRSGLRLAPLIAATYFMVAGGPYGLEDILGMAGYGRALLLLIIIPLAWSLPTSLMVGELASALPVEGGYYCWVRRALGGFWGFQEAWLSLAASIFDMAIYPTLFVLYLERLEPAWTAGPRATLWALAVVLLCAAWNLLGAKAVGEGSVGVFCVLIAPFVVLVLVCLRLILGGHPGTGFAALGRPAAVSNLSGAVLVTLWNYMGWDNASTVAQEVHEPQRNYPRAMLIATALVTFTYVLPLAAVGLSGIPAESFVTGAWVTVAGQLLGPGPAAAALALAIVVGGMLSALGMFNALTLSYTRLPCALAEEGLLPPAFIRKTAAGVPWLSVLVLSAAWALALRFSFERLIAIDLVLYGASLVLEFIALVILRLREPALHRPFKIPGGTLGTIAIGIAPTLLILYALWAARDERVAGIPALAFSTLVAALGPLAYLLARLYRRKRAASLAARHPTSL